MNVSFKYSSKAVDIRHLLKQNTHRLLYHLRDFNAEI